jgi:hypothetical protein
MPFGKYRDQPLTACDSGYLYWVLRECHNAPTDLIAAIRDEIARRQRTTATNQYTLSPLPARATRNAVLQLLSDLIAAGFRVVARGEGAVYCYGVNLPPALERRLKELHSAIDLMARLLRWKPSGEFRVTPASTLLSALAAQGIDAIAMPDGVITCKPAIPAQSPLHDGIAANASEIWFRAAVHMPLSGIQDYASVNGRAGAFDSAPAQCPPKKGRSRRAGRDNDKSK